MTELERALVALGNELEFPPTPDVWPRVAGRLQRRRRLRPAALALAVVALAIGVAFAVPDARSAILRFLHIGNATIERVDTLPAAPNRPLVSGLGPALSKPTLRVPPGTVARHYYARPGLAAALLRYQGKDVLFAELHGDQMGLMKKVIGNGTHVSEVGLGEFGVWIRGAQHVLLWQFDATQIRSAQTRLAGNVLIWLQNGITYRLEGDLEQRPMLELARQITP
jgi:hypothetical protein